MILAHLYNGILPRESPQTGRIPARRHRPFLRGACGFLARSHGFAVTFTGRGGDAAASGWESHARAADVRFRRRPGWTGLIAGTPSVFQGSPARHHLRAHERHSTGQSAATCDRACLTRGTGRLRRGAGRPRSVPPAAGQRAHLHRERTAPGTGGRPLAHGDRQGALRPPPGRHRPRPGGAHGHHPGGGHPNHLRPAREGRGPEARRDRDAGHSQPGRRREAGSHRRAACRAARRRAGGRAPVARGAGHDRQQILLRHRAQRRQGRLSPAPHLRPPRERHLHRRRSCQVHLPRAVPVRRLPLRHADPRPPVRVGGRGARPGLRVRVLRQRVGRMRGTGRSRTAGK